MYTNFSYYYHRNYEKSDNPEDLLYQSKRLICFHEHKFQRPFFCKFSSSDEYHHFDRKRRAQEYMQHCFESQNH